MPAHPKDKLTLRDIRGLQPGQTIWDGAVKGLAARRQVSTVVSYYVGYRTPDGRKRTFTIGKHGSPWTPETARQEARRILREVANGGDPVGEKAANRQAITVAELCREYLADVEAGRVLTKRKAAKRASTLISDRGRIERHIVPLLGRKPVASVTRDDVERLMHDVAAGKTVSRKKTKPRGVSIVRGGRGVATRTVGLLGGIFSYAVRKGYRIDNPAHGIVRFADGRRQRRLSDDEYRQLATALDTAKVWKPAIAAPWLMILTGWRRGEVLGLRWCEVDLARRTARLTDTKTGASMRALSEKACALIRSQPRNGEWVFPARSGAAIVGYRKMWLKIAATGKLASDITPHVLRHSFASLAADMGYSESTIAALIGHKNHSITSRYLHSADAVLLAAADAVAAETWRLMGSPVIGGMSAQMDQPDDAMWDELTFL